MANSKKTHGAKKPAKKAAPKKAAASRKASPAKKPAKAPAKKAKPVTRKVVAKKRAKSARKTYTPAIKSKVSKQPKGHGKNGKETNAIIGSHKARERRLDPFTRAQKERLLQLRDAMVDSMAGVAQDTLRARAEGSEASAFGMHQADAGSDAYDRDFALSLLSQEQDALYEIDEALKRIEIGTYGKCEMSGKPIMRARLEAIPFARYTVECQSQLEKQNKASRVRQSVTSLFGLTDDESREGDEEEKSDDNKE
ncbi:MAG TPA: TraR/DksA C4-type zinc finger protein [Chthoniobacterales bacterium]|jgi:RNA polymerase-binding transcription factor DksA